MSKLAVYGSVCGLKNDNLRFVVLRCFVWTVRCGRKKVNHAGSRLGDIARLLYSFLPNCIAEMWFYLMVWFDWYQIPHNRKNWFRIYENESSSWKTLEQVNAETYSISYNQVAGLACATIIRRWIFSEFRKKEVVNQGSGSDSTSAFVPR